jgi:hypothetical protein
MTLWFAIPIGAAGVALAILLWRLSHRTPRLVVGERGIRQRGQGWGWIPWEEIEGAYPPTVGETDILRLRLRVTERLARILRKRRRMDEHAPLEDRLEIRLDLADSDVNAVELLQEILAHQPPDRHPR